MIVSCFIIVSLFPWILSILCLIFGGMCFIEAIKKESFGKFIVSITFIGCGIFYSILALQKQEEKTPNPKIVTNDYTYND